MNKFSLLFIAFVFFGGIIASNTGDVQKQEAPVVTSASTVPAQAVGEQASAPSSDPLKSSCLWNASPGIQTFR